MNSIQRRRSGSECGGKVYEGNWKGEGGKLPKCTLYSGESFKNWKAKNVIWLLTHPSRDRPANLQGGGGYVFLFRSEFFLDNMRVRIIFQNLTLGYDKNSESDYFFLSSTKIRIFVFNNVENQNIFFRKKT